MKARLFCADTAALSGDILDRQGHFSGWNTIIGEGDATCAADDVLVEASVSVPGADDARNLPGRLVLTASRNGKVIATRTNANILVPLSGSSTTVLYLADVGCAGTITVTARYGTQRRSALLAMACGE